MAARDGVPGEFGLVHQSGGVSHYKICGTTFLLECHYVPQKAIGTGAYGVVCSAKMQPPDPALPARDVAIKKIANAYHNSEVGERRSHATPPSQVFEKFHANFWEISLL
jgi:hypothetical protein